MQGFELGLVGTSGERQPVDQSVVDLSFRVRDSVSTTCIGLGIDIDQQGWAFRRSEARSEIYGGGRFADSALLIHDCNDVRARTQLRSAQWAGRRRMMGMDRPASPPDCGFSAEARSWLSDRFLTQPCSIARGESVRAIAVVHEATAVSCGQPTAFGLARSLEPDIREAIDP